MRRLTILIAVAAMLLAGCDLVDTDGDFIPDRFENAAGRNPNDPDEDLDGVLDGIQDTDGDGIRDWDEINLGFDPNDPSIPDTSDVDGDLVQAWFEALIGTDPDDPDTDHDGASDGFELTVGTNPLDGSDTPVQVVIGDCIVGGPDAADPMTWHFAWDDTRPFGCDLTGTPVDLRWNFEGDEVSTGETRTASFTFSGPGIFWISADALEPGTGDYLASGWLVAAPGAPQASAYSGCMTATVDHDNPLQVHFQWYTQGLFGGWCGQGCSPTGYTWNFGDGTQTTTAGTSVTHTYAQGGAYWAWANTCSQDAFDSVDLHLVDLPAP